MDRLLALRNSSALAFAAEAIGEAMDRVEIKKVLEALDAGAVAEGNVFAPESGDTKLDYPKVVEMYESLSKYGTKFVFVTGSNVTNDVTLMDYVADKNRPYSLQNLNITHIPVLDYTVDVDGSGQEELIDPDVAYLVAVSDAKGRKPILVARRSMAIVGGAADTTVVEKQRIVIDTGNIKNVGSTVKFAKGKSGYEEFGMVLMNSKVVAKFSK
jgi:hypothetical protein